MKNGTIIFLNGVSSSGKTTLAKALVRELPGYFHLGVDDFDLLIEQMEDRANHRLIPIGTEVFFHETIAMFSRHGVNLVVDTILNDRAATENAFAVLADFPILFVGVHCPVEELERREQSRGDRTVGQGRGQLTYVHRQEVYDVEVDTCQEPTTVSIGRIIKALQDGGFPRGWQLTREKWLQNSVGRGT